MHQSPQKLPATRREKYADFDNGDADTEAERRTYRASQPKARKFPLREEFSPGEQRWDKQHSRG